MDKLAFDLRKSILDIAYRAKSPHIGSCLSCTDIFSAVFEILDFGAALKDLQKFADNNRAEFLKNANKEIAQNFAQRDIFLLSKAHSAMALYAILGEFGLLSQKRILGYFQNNGTLPAHTDRDCSPFVEISAGSLGHALPMAVGLAHAINLAIATPKHTSGILGANRFNENRFNKTSAKSNDIESTMPQNTPFGELNSEIYSKIQKTPPKRKRRVFVLLGDGECQEGSIWEAAMMAPHLELNNLVVLIDRNNLQGYGRASEILSYERIDEKFRAFGWEVARVNGHDKNAILGAILEHFEKVDSMDLIESKSAINAPLCVVCDTIKGRGVDFMQDELKWHYFLLTDELYSSACAALSEFYQNAEKCKTSANWAEQKIANLSQGGAK